MRVGAVHTDPRPGIDVQLAVNHDLISGMSWHRRREGGVVVDLEHLTRRDLDLEPLVAARLRGVGHVFEADGATWLRTTDFGDDKDRVLRKSDGDWTYFAGDCAYYLDKRERGFDRVVIMLGADHHGYLGRMRAMAACFCSTPSTSGWSPTA